MKLLISTICLLFGLTAVANADPISAVVATAVAGGLQGAIVRIGLSLAVSFITNKLFGPEVPATNSDAQQSPDPGVKQRIATDTNNKLPVVYGSAKVFGSITHAAISSDNQKMAFIIPLCEGPIEEIGDVFWDTYKLQLDGNGNVTGGTDQFGSGTLETTDFFLTGNLKIIKKLGTLTGNQSTEMEAFDTAKWGDANKSFRTLPGVAYLYVELTYDREEGVTGLSAKLGAIVKGKLVSKINRGPNTGTTLNPIYAYSLAETKTYSDNPADCLADYLTSNVYGCGSIVTSSDLDLETFYNHQQYCLTNVASMDSSNNTVLLPRFQLNGVANTHDTRDLTISDICNNSQAVLSYQLGKFQMNSDRRLTGPELAVVPSFNEDTMYGDVTTVNDGFNSQLNKFTGSFVSKVGLFQDDQVYLDLFQHNADGSIKLDTDGKPISAVDANGNALLGTDEPEFIQDTRFKFIDNNVQAERIGYTVLRKSRDALIISFTTDIRALELQVNDVIKVSNKVYSYNNKDFRVNSITETEIAGGLLGYKITAQEYNSSAYNDDVENPFTQFAVSPNVNISSPSNIGTVTTFSATANASNDEVTFSWVTPTGIIDAFEILFLTSTTAITSFSSAQLSARTLLASTNSGQYTPGTTNTYKTSDLPSSPFIYFWIRGANSYGFKGAYNTNDPVINVTNYISTATQGAAGIFTKTLYQRSATALVAPTGVTYDGTVFANLGDWKETIAATVGTDNLYATYAIVNPADNSIGTWDTPITIEGVAGTQGVSTTTLRIYISSATVDPVLPTGSTYNFTSGTLNFGTANGWSRGVPSASTVNTIYTAQATVQTTTPDTDVTVAWTNRVIFTNPVYEVYAYAKPDGTTIPLAPQAGTGTINSFGVLSAGPTANATQDDSPSTEPNIQWEVSLNPFNINSEQVYRSTAPVNGRTPGTWSDPVLFALSGNDGASGPAGPTNIVRYGAFASDEAAQTNRLTSLTNNGNGLNANWVSSPDLLGIDALGNARSYTHTTTQFGTIEFGGNFTSQEFTIGGSVTSTAGAPAVTTMTYQDASDPDLDTNFTIWEGQTNTSTTASLSTGITRNDYVNLNAPNVGWNHDTGAAVFAADTSLDSTPTTYTVDGETVYNGALGTAWNVLETGFSFSNRRLYIEINGDGRNSIYTSTRTIDASEIGTSGVAWTAADFIEAWTDGGNERYSGRTVSGFDNGSGNITLFQDPGNDGQMFFNLSDNSTLRDVFENITTIHFGFTLSSTSNTPSQALFSLAAIDFGTNTANGRGNDWIQIENTADRRFRHEGILVDIERNNSNLVSGTQGFALGEQASDYLEDFRATIQGSFAVLTAVLDGDDIDITFANDGQDYTIPEWAAAGSVSEFVAPNIVSLDEGEVEGNLPQQYIIDITPTFKNSIDYTSLNEFRYSDAYTTTPAEHNYPTLSSVAGILSEMQVRLDGQSHVDVTVHNGTTLRFSYTATVDYGLTPGTVAAGPSNGFDGAVPQPFIHFGEDSDGSIITGLTVATHQEGRGAGRLINLDGDAFTRPSSSLVIDGPGINLNEPYAVFESYDFTFEIPQNFTTTISPSLQIYNAVRVLLPTFYTQVIPANFNQLILTTVADVPTSEHPVSINGNGWVTTNVMGELGDPYTITLSRTNSDEFGDAEHVINLMGSSTIADIIAEFALQDAKLGSYIIAGANTIQIQDAGTGPTLYKLELGVGAGADPDLVPADSGLTITPNPATTVANPQGDDQIGRSTDYLLPGDPVEAGETVLASSRWTRPVNTGVQV